MKKRICTIVLTLFCLCLLTACSCQHEWAEATCTTAKVCSKCEETEGEALGHIWEDATCTTPKTCSVCGETEGEALAHTWDGSATYQTPEVCSACGAEGDTLPAYFEEHGLSINVQADTAREYVTCTSNPDLDTVGKLTASNYRVFESDEKHAAKEGYEWRAVDIRIVFDDENSSLYGPIVTCCKADYYCASDLYEAGDKAETFTVNYNGTEYTNCVASFENVNFDIQHNVSITFSVECYFQVPIGYDGVVLAFYHGGIDVSGMHLNEVADENMLLYRLA